jgi:hypothetical protein
MWLDALYGFGPLVLLGLIAFIYSWRAIDREHRKRMQDSSGRSSQS